MELRTLNISSDDFRLLILLFLFPVLLLFFGSIRKKSSGGLKLPPSQYALPFVGHIFGLDAKKPHIALANIANSLGPLFSLRFGSMTVVVASNSDAAREVFKIHDRELSGRFELHVGKKVPGVNDSVIALATECDDRWRSLRSMAHTELFSSQALESQSQLRLDKMEQMLQFLSSKDGKVVKIADPIFATVVNSLSMAMTSHDIIRNWENMEETKSHMRKLLQFSIPGIGDIYPLLGGLDFGMNRKVSDYMEVCKALWGDILTERKRHGQDAIGGRNPDLLETLIKNSWGEMQIFNLLTEFFASSESMTTATEWAIVELTRNQEALAKLRKELDEAIGEGRLIRERDLGKLPYFQACIKETLRLHPPSPFLVPRVAVQTCKLMNFDIPKGSLVVTNAYALGRDPKTWEEPMSFKPERFLDSSIDVKGTNYELLPFGGGRRICAGYPLALKQIQLLLASIVHSFDWSIPGEGKKTKVDMGEEFGITLRKEKPMLLILKKRSEFKIE